MCEKAGSGSEIFSYLSHNTLEEGSTELIQLGQEGIDQHVLCDDGGSEVY